MPRLLLTAPHAVVHAHVGPPIVGKGVHYLRLRPYLTETGDGEMERGAALEGEGPGQGHIKLVMRSMDHPSQRQVGQEWLDWCCMCGRAIALLFGGRAC